jgi:4-carboxymuconolactone decarboxylase
MNMTFRFLMTVLAAVGAATSLQAQTLSDVQTSNAPLVLKAQGSFFVGGEKVEQTQSELGNLGPGGRITVNQMYVRYMVPQAGDGNVPVVMIHGATLTGKTWETTPDGRMGWDEYFVRKGHAVYVPDQVGRGRSGFNQAIYNNARGGSVAPDKQPELLRFSDENVWSNFRFGPKAGVSFDDNQFPVAAVDELSKQAVPDMNRGLPTPTPTIKALSDLAGQLKGAVLMGHSQSGSFPLAAALLDPKVTKGLVLVEPGTCPANYTDDQIKTLASVPILVVFGDHRDNPTGLPTLPTWQARFEECQKFISRVRKAGGQAQMLDPSERGIHGNTHMIMQDKNNLQIADLILQWLRERVSKPTVRAQERRSVAPKNMQAIVPALADYTDNVLFGDVWVRPELAPRDRSLVTVSALIATGKTPQLAGHLNRALVNGLQPSEIAGVVTHLAFYTGWPNAVSALNVVEEVFAERRIDMSVLQQTKRAQTPASRSETFQSQEVAAVAPKLAQVTESVVFDDLWRRPDLSPRDRSFVTIAALAANGDTGQLAMHVRRGLDNGLTRVQIGEALTHLAFYAGLPRATAAAAIASSAMTTEAKDVKTAGANRLIVVEPKTQKRTAPASNFTGSVTVESPFRGSGDSRLGGATVTFQPSARTNWHIHPLGQLLVVTEGEGLVQVEGEAVRAIKSGDVVWTAPGVKHWHGATATRSMTHVAVSESLEGEAVEWLGPVTASEYRAL